MSIVSSIFLIVALVLAVLIGPQTRDWSWGPAMVALGIAVISAIPLIWKRKKAPLDLGVLVLGMLTVGWFTMRTVVSPVPELGRADLLLLASAVAAFIVIRAIEGHTAAERILSWGIALLLLASIIVVGVQFYHPDYTPIFHSRGVVLPSGFYGHYNEGANFVIAASLLVAAAAAFGKHSLATRILFGLLVVAGFAAVYVSRSRGGIFGASIGLGVFLTIAIIIAKRRNSRWFAPAIIAIPIIGTALVTLLLMGWVDAQKVRFGSDTMLSLLDNNIRFFMAGIAVSCISLHPWEGGGSRSYSWECYRFWDSDTHGYAGAKPELVHNELLQAATDYGLIGAGILLALLLTIVIISIVRVVLSDQNANSNSHAWRIGGLAAFFGMFTQSNFSFVFHIIPQIILLGACLGFAAHSSSHDKMGNASRLVSKLMITGIAMLCIAVLIPYGIKGSKVTLALWPSMFGKTPLTSSDARMDGLSAAIRIWPQSQFYQERAALYREAANEAEKDWAKTDEIKNAIRDYDVARVLHSYDPTTTINQGMLFSSLNRDLEAEEAFTRTIELQGGMETIFPGYYQFANHLFQKGLREFREGASPKAIETLDLAASKIAIALQMIPGRGIPLQISIHESLGAAREETKDYEGALKDYNFTSSIPGGESAHYRAGALLGKLAVQAWSERKPSDAMAGFIAARNRVTIQGALPVGITPEQRAEYLAYLDRTIKFLEGARITPTPSK